MRRMAVCRHIWPHMLAMAATYTVTLALYPGLETRLASCSLGSWLTLALMTVFNLTDLAGKVEHSYSYDIHDNTVWLCCAAGAGLHQPLLVAAPRLAGGRPPGQDCPGAAPADGRHQVLAPSNLARG